MIFKTFWFTYSVEKFGNEYIIKRSCWLWGVPDRYVDKFGGLQNEVDIDCYFSEHKVAEIRLVKYLKYIQIY